MCLQACVWICRLNNDRAFHQSLGRGCQYLSADSGIRRDFLPGNRSSRTTGRYRFIPRTSKKPWRRLRSYFQENREIPDEADDWSGISHKIHAGIGAALGLLAGHIFMIHHGGIAFFRGKIWRIRISHPERRDLPDRHRPDDSRQFSASCRQHGRSGAFFYRRLQCSGIWGRIFLRACLRRPGKLLSPRFFTNPPIFRSGHPPPSSGRSAFLSSIRHSAASGLPDSASGYGFPWEAVSVCWDCSAKESIPIFWPIFLAWEAAWQSAAYMKVLLKKPPCTDFPVSLPFSGPCRYSVILAAVTGYFPWYRGSRFSLKARGPS